MGREKEANERNLKFLREGYKSMKKAQIPCRIEVVGQITIHKQMRKLKSQIQKIESVLPKISICRVAFQRGENIVENKEHYERIQKIKDLHENLKIARRKMRALPNFG